MWFKKLLISSVLCTSMILGSATGIYAASTAYTVQKGDTYWIISQKLDVPITGLMAANNATQSTIIYPGQKIVVPQYAAHIKSTIGDVHKLPFPDNHFDIVTLQFASRHLRVREVFTEILRVLKPGGHFHHSDMLRPRNPVVKTLYYTYLKMCLNFTSLMVKSGPSAVKCKQYFLDALELFYTAEELTVVLQELGFVEVTSVTVFSGMLGFHRAVKPQPAA